MRRRVFRWPHEPSWTSFHAPLLRDCWVRGACAACISPTAPASSTCSTAPRTRGAWIDLREQARFAWTNGVIATRLPRPETVAGDRLRRRPPIATFDADLRAALRHRHQRTSGAAGATTLRRSDLSPCPATHSPSASQTCRRWSISSPLARWSTTSRTPRGLSSACRLLGRACSGAYLRGPRTVCSTGISPILAGCERDRFSFGDVEWIAVWWRNENYSRPLIQTN